VTTPDRLRAVGLRATRPRVAVLDALAGDGVHRSVEELLAAFAARQVRLARASVYNVLDDLVATGLVMLADVGPGRALYEVADDWHHHFVCRHCRQVTDVPCAAGSRPCLEASVPGAEVDEAQVIFRGLCADCRSVQTTSVAGAGRAIA
jgi:Fur family ferric uptake transcriptional regulator